MGETAVDLLVAASWCAAAGLTALAGRLVELAGELLSCPALGAPGRG